SCRAFIKRFSSSESPSEPTREELIALIKAQAAEIAALKARIAELERRLGLNSSKSGKPPSGDGLKKPPGVTSLREPSDKPSGGQKGHKGETLRQIAEPDRIVDHYPPACTACGAAMTPAMSAGHSARQVFDLPEPTPLDGGRASCPVQRPSLACSRASSGHVSPRHTTQEQPFEVVV